MTADEMLNSEDGDSQKDKYLTFHIGGEDYAIPISHVIEIIGMMKITEVPQTAHYVKGVINLRGKVIPVMDIRLRFEMESREYDERTCVIVVNFNSNIVGLVVDTVSEVLDIPAENIENYNQMSKSGRENFVSKMGKVDDRIKMILNVDSLLNQREEEHELANCEIA